MVKLTHLDLSSCSELSSVSELWPEHALLGPFPDVVPRQELQPVCKPLASPGPPPDKYESSKKMETMFLLSILLIAIVWLYLFPPPD